MRLLSTIIGVLAAIGLSTGTAAAQDSCGTDFSAFVRSTDLMPTANWAAKSYKYKVKHIKCFDKYLTYTPPKREFASNQRSYGRLRYTIVGFDSGLSEKDVRGTLGGFLSRFFYSQGHTESLFIEADIGVGAKISTPIFSVTNESGKKGKGVTSQVWTAGALTPWLPLRGQDLTAEFKVRSAKSLDPHILTTIATQASAIAGLQASPTRVLSAMTTDFFKTKAEELQKGIRDKANIDRKSYEGFSLPLYPRDDEDFAGIFVELTDFQGKPSGGIIIYTEYKNSIFANDSDVQTPDFSFAQPGSFTGQEFGEYVYRKPGSPDQTFRTFYQYLLGVETELMTNFKSTDIAKYREACLALWPLLKDVAGLQEYDRLAVLWDLVRGPSSGYTQSTNLRDSGCPSGDQEQLREEIKLPPFSARPLNAAERLRHGYEGEVLGRIAHALNIMKLLPNQGSVISQTIDDLERYAPSVKFSDPSNITRQIRPPKNQAMDAAAFSEPLRKIAGAYGVSDCRWTSQNQITEEERRQGRALTDTERSVIPMLAKMLMRGDANGAYLDLQVDYPPGARANTPPNVVVQRLASIDAVHTRRAEYGCSAEIFPLPGDAAETAESGPAAGESQGSERV